MHIISTTSRTAVVVIEMRARGCRTELDQGRIHGSRRHCETRVEVQFKSAHATGWLWRGLAQWKGGASARAPAGGVDA